MYLVVPSHVKGRLLVLLLGRMKVLKEMMLLKGNKASQLMVRVSMIKVVLLLGKGLRVREMVHMFSIRVWRNGWVSSRVSEGLDSCVGVAVFMGSSSGKSNMKNPVICCCC